MATRESAIIKLQEELDQMEHKYTVTLEGANNKQEKINSMRDRLAAKDLEIKKLEIIANKSTEEVSGSVW